MSDTSFGLGVGAGLPTERLTQLELIGAGAQGLLYRAHDATLDRTVAVKVLTGERSLARVSPSVRAQAQLSWHPFVMTVFDAGVTPDGLPYIVMEYLSGGSCEQLRKRGPIAPDRAIQIARQLCDALLTAHEHHLLHCDVKPSNILLDGGGNARLGDFGSARDLDRSAPTLDELQATITYVAPELLEGSRPTAASDVYSFAVTVWTLATGELPWPRARTLAEAIATRLHSDRLAFDRFADRPRLQRLLEQATDADPDRRPLLSEIRDDLVPYPEPSPAAGRLGRPSPRRSAWLAAAITLIIGSLVGYSVRPLSAEQTTRRTRTASAARFCTDLLAARATHVSGLNGLDGKITHPNPGYAVMRQLLVTYPEQFAAAYAPAIADAAHVKGLASSTSGLNARSLADMVTVDALYRLQYDQPLVDTSQLVAKYHTGVSAEVWRSAEAYAALQRDGQTRCAHQQSTESARSITAAISVVIDGLRGQIVAGKVDGFFDDPRSFDLLDAGRVDLLMSSAPGLVDALLANQVPWLVHLLTRHPAVGSLLMADHLPEIISFLDGRPDVVAELVAQHPGWASEMRTRFLELTDVGRKALTTEYSTTLRALGVLSAADQAGS